MSNQICYKKGVVIEIESHPGIYFEIIKMKKDSAEVKVIKLAKNQRYPVIKMGDKVTITFNTKVIPTLKAALYKGVK